MKTFDHQSDLPGSAQQVYDWHSRPGAFERLVPPWQRLIIRRQEGDFGNRQIWLEGRVGPFPMTWQARHQNAVPGERFTDVMIAGPFRHWQHDHRFVSTATGCRLEDHVEYDGAAAMIANSWVQATLARLFRFRHERTRHDLTRHAAWTTPARVAVTGGTGLMGTALIAFLRSGGHQVLRVTRHAQAPEDVEWNPAAGRIDRSRLEGLDAVVHLAGHNIASSLWSTAERRRILDSRVVGTTFLCETLAGLSKPPGVLVSGSAVGIYGGHDAQPIDETASVGAGFLADVCAQWEAATQPAEQAGIRTVHLRTGLVLTALLARMAPPFRLGLGATLGDGRQFMPWVALDDIIGIIGHAIFSPSMVGPLNATAPEPVSAKTFSQTLGAALHRPAFMHVPRVVIETALGDMGREVLLQGCNAVPQRLLSTGFQFFYPNLRSALSNELP